MEKLVRDYEHRLIQYGGNLTEKDVVFTPTQDVHYERLMTKLEKVEEKLTKIEGSNTMIGNLNNRKKGEQTNL